MKEITVETTGNFQLLDRYSGRLIPHEGSVTIPHTPFVAERLKLKQLVESSGKADKSAEPVPTPVPVPPLADLPTPAEETPADLPTPAEVDNDADDDGHDDRNGQFVEGNQEATKPKPKPAKARRGK